MLILARLKLRLRKGKMRLGKRQNSISVLARVKLKLRRGKNEVGGRGKNSMEILAAVKLHLGHEFGLSLYLQATPSIWMQLPS